MPCYLADEGRSIAGAGSDLEHFVTGIQIGLFEHQRHDERLRNCLALADRQRCILIGEFLGAWRNEFSRGTMRIAPMTL